MNIEKGKDLAQAWFKNQPFVGPEDVENMLGDDRLAWEYLQLVNAYERLLEGGWVAVDDHGALEPYHVFRTRIEAQGAAMHLEEVSGLKYKVVRVTGGEWY